MDGAGNRSVKTFNVRVRDTTPPLITFVSTNLVVEASGAPGTIVNFLPATAIDAAGPVAITYSKASGSYFALGTTTVVVTATDGAGNAATATFTVKVQDTTLPVIVITGVKNLDTFDLNAHPTPTFAVTDSGSGVDPATVVTTLTGPGTASGAGQYTYTVTAKDRAGNSATARITYFVFYRISGLSTTPAAPGNFVLNLNILVKFQLHDARGALVTNAVATLTVDGSPAVSGGTDAGNRFTFSGAWYVFTLKTTALAAGDHLLQITRDDGVVHGLMIKLSAGPPPVVDEVLTDDA
jgi:hypothetical protein